ncbi:MAG: hypothetical protein ACOYM5_06215 [Caulobacter sp.]
MKTTILAGLALALGLGLSAQAAEVTARGTGSVATKGLKPDTVRALATREAKKRAVIMAVEKVLGAGASADARVAAKIDSIVEQIGDDSITDTSAQTVAGRYEVSLTISVDDKAFRTLLSDVGVANPAAARAYSLLVIFDEYHTTPSDIQAPLADLEVYRRRSGSSVSANYDAAAYERSSDRAAYSSSAGASSSGAVVGRGGAAYGQSSAAAREAGAASSTRSAGAAVSASLDASTHDDTDYTHLVLYQPRSTAAEASSPTYNAFKGQLQDYDLRVLDNDMFRSRYFAGKPMTLQEMTNGSELYRYAGYARDFAKADFFTAGVVVVIDAGRDARTGEAICTGMVTVKTYSTSTGEDIASDTFSETGAGRIPTPARPTSPSSWQASAGR